MPTPLPTTDPTLDSGVDAGADGSKPRGSRCGCDVIGGDGSGYALAVAGLLAFAIGARRRRGVSRA